jgi:hypothetical protein
MKAIDGESWQGTFSMTPCSNSVSSELSPSFEFDVANTVGMPCWKLQGRMQSLIWTRMFIFLTHSFTERSPPDQSELPQVLLLANLESTADLILGRRTRMTRHGQLTTLSKSGPKTRMSLRKRCSLSPFANSK